MWRAVREVLDKAIVIPLFLLLAVFPIYRQRNGNEVCTMEDLIFIKPGNRIKLEYRKNKYPLELYFFMLALTY